MLLVSALRRGISQHLGDALSYFTDNIKELEELSTVSREKKKLEEISDSVENLSFLSSLKPWIATISGPDCIISSFYRTVTGLFMHRHGQLAESYEPHESPKNTQCFTDMASFKDL